MSIEKICIYDTESIKSIFEKGDVLSYGNGRYYQKVQNHLAQFGYIFKDILTTKDNQIISKSGINFNHIKDNSTILICSTFCDEIIDILKKNLTDEENIKIIELQHSDTKYATKYKQEIAKILKGKHKNLVEKIKNKNKIKIIFLAINKGIWKVDLIFKKFLNNPIFEPIVLVIPHLVYGEELAFKRMEELYNYFKEKKYPVVLSYDKSQERWITLEDLKADIVFFTKPHNSTRKEYYQDAYLNYLCCYTGYGVNVATLLKNNSQFDQIFHNAQWINFANSNFVYDTYKKLSSSGAKNVILTGDLTCEELLEISVEKIVWKIKDDRKRVIYAPHHSIEHNNIFNYGLSTFLIFGENIKKLALKYKDKIVWAFKPHPVLKPKLYNHPNWGREKTDEYYNFWENQEFTQLEEADYIDLFKQSDAMIHDSASFLYEYLTLKKPVAYLTSEITENSLNTLGNEALNACLKASSLEDIEVFINKVISNDIEITDNHKSFFDKEFIELYSQEKPSEKIYNTIKNNLLGKL